MVTEIGNETNFGFAFNDSNMSDRVIRLEIVPSNIYSRGENRNIWPKVRTLHISSPILAAKSPFFLKMFTNGMRETHQRNEVTLRIDESEEEALMELLSFMYKNTLSATSAPDLLNVMMVADKYEVTSCTKYCVEMLLKLPMSLEFALFYLQLPSTVLAGEAVQPLISSAKQYFSTSFRDLQKSEEEAMTLPLCAIEAVIGSDGLQVNKESVVYKFVLRWARAHYLIPEQRQEVLAKLARFLCFQYMSCSELEQVLTCPDFYHKRVTKMVTKALSSKIEGPYGYGNLTTCNDLPRRVYIHKPVKVLQFESTQPRCVVYFDLQQKDCMDKFSSKQLGSEKFKLGGKWFYIIVKCIEEQESSSHHLCITVHMVPGRGTCTLGYEIAVMKNQLKEFECKVKGGSWKFADNGLGTLNKLGISSADLLKENSEYFIDGILHIRVDLTIKD